MFALALATLLGARGFEAPAQLRRLHGGQNLVDVDVFDGVVVNHDAVGSASATTTLSRDCSVLRARGQSSEAAYECPFSPSSA